MNIDAQILNQAIVMSIEDSAIPRVDRAKIIAFYGPEHGESIADEVVAIVRAAASTPIEWGNMTLAEGVEDILNRFSMTHPELSPQALAEIGRCVGWQLR